jgi:carbamoyl-phosphate synthase large subunit
VAADKALFTTIAQVGAAVASLEERPEHPEVKSLQDYAAERITA